MEEQFEYGELVEVRDYDHEEWIPAVYVGVLPGYNRYWTRGINANENHSEVPPIPWKQIRKIQKPEPTNKPEPIEFWVGRLQTQVMSLMDRLSKIEDELHIKSMNKPVKNIK